MYLGMVFAVGLVENNKIKKEDKFMAFIDYYKILGVDKTIPQKDVKRRI